MVAYANGEALAATMESGEAHFYSRSRGRLWKKGETSGNVLKVAEVYADCDRDTLLYMVEPTGPACHTGETTCFFEVLGQRGPSSDEGDSAPGVLSPATTKTIARPVMDALFFELEARRDGKNDESYTRTLLDRGAPKIAAKIQEEAGEYIAALAEESAERVACEAADLVYHQLVGLLSRQVSWDDVVRVLASRFDQSGLAEKRARRS